MKTKNKIILVLLIIGVLSFGVIQFITVPYLNAKDKAYSLAQQNPVTQDLNYILPHKNLYLGNNSNTIGLFYHLPLSESGMRFQIFPKDLSLKINYPYTISSRGKSTIYQSLIYNSVAGFALISNLEKVTYMFTDQTITITKKDLKKIFPNPAALLNKTTWQTQVQTPLRNHEFVEKCQKIMLQIK